MSPLAWVLLFGYACYLTGLLTGAILLRGKR